MRTLLFILLSCCATSAYCQNIGIVLTSEAAPYQEALEGFREVIRYPIGSVQILQKENSAGWQQQLKRLRFNMEPDLVFVIGTRALQLVSNEVKNIPIVHALALNHFESSVAASKNVSGISMVPSANQVISLVRELNPKFRRIGTMHDPSRGAQLFAQARAAFQKNGLQLVSKEIRSAGDIGAGLKSLASDIDIFWLWPDERYLTDEILQRIVLFSFENQIPVIGLSEGHTDMGALLSLSYSSARDLGRQAGELANSILRDPMGVQRSIGAPRQIKFTVNLRTAQKLDVELPRDLLLRADNAIKAPVYRNGDWWKFRTTVHNTIGTTKTEIHRVFYKDNKFQSDNPFFLTGGDMAGSQLFLPFASVYLTDPARRWLEFPMLPGFKWSFRYPRAHTATGVAGRVSARWADAQAVVVGKVPGAIETPAGKFEAIEIQRTDYFDTRGELNYFYSPTSKSVVKLRAEMFGRFESRFELELVAFGNDPSFGKGSQ